MSPWLETLSARARAKWSAVLTEARDVFAFAEPVMAESRVPLLAASLGINVLALALPIFILQIYDRVLPNQATTTLTVLGVGLAVAVALDVALRALRTNLATWNGARLEHLLRFNAMRKLLDAPLDRVECDSPAAHLERINAVGAVRDFHAGQVLLLAVDLPFAIFFLGLIAYLGTWLVLVPAALLVLFGLGAAAIGRALRTSVADRADADRRRYDFVLQALTGIASVKALAFNAQLLRRHETLQEESAVLVRRVMHLSGLAQTLGGLFAQLNMVLLMSCGAALVLNGAMTAGALAACTLLSGRALQPLQSAMGLWTSFQSVRVARQQIAKVMSLPSERQRTEHVEAFHGEVGEIEIKDLVFRHSAAGPAILDYINLIVRPGRIVGIEGGGGSGKTTLLMLIAGLLEPEAGAVRLNGRDVRDFDPRSWRSQIAFLPQQGAIFSGTILDNLTTFREGECINEALYLSYLLGLDDAVKRLPDGFDTRVGPGETLPAGLKQRIALVRELVKHPRVILFDDADGALDAQSIRRLHFLLQQLAQRSILILASQKPQTLQMAHERYALRRGKLHALLGETLPLPLREISA